MTEKGITQQSSREFEYWSSHHQELQQEFGGKWVVIIGETVVGAHKKANVALKVARRGIKFKVPFVTYIETDKEAKMPFAL